VTLLQTLSTKANVTGTIKIRDVLNIASGDTAALAASFNVLDLVTGAAYAANGSHSVAVPGLVVQVPGVASLVTSLTVGDPPKLACGGRGKATAQTGQVDLTFSGDLANVSSNIAGLTTPLGVLGSLVAGVVNGVVSGTVTAATHISAEAHLAQAKGTLTNIVCGDATTVSNAEGIDVQVSASLLSSLSTAETIRLTGSLPLKAALPILGTTQIATITVDLSSSGSATTSQGTTTSTVSFRHPNDGYGTPKSYGSGIVLAGLSAPTLSPTAKVHVTFLNPAYGTSGDVNVTSITGLATVLNNLLTTATSNVNTNVVSPINNVVTPQLAKQLGIKVGGADVFALPRPSCNDPQLAG
jgi:hypothetical protein